MNAIFDNFLSCLSTKKIEAHGNREPTPITNQWESIHWVRMIGGSQIKNLLLLIQKCWCKWVFTIYTLLNFTKVNAYFIIYLLVT